MYDNNIEEQQISEVTGHKSIAICNYKCTSMVKQQEVSEILYGKHKKKLEPTVTVTKAELNFELGINSQAENIGEIKSDVSVIPTVNINVGNVEIKAPVVTIEQPQITVSPVINLCQENLTRNAQGVIVLPKINVALTININ